MMNINNYDIAISNSCAKKYEFDSKIVDFRTGVQIVDFIFNTEKDFSLFVLEDCDVNFQLPLPNNDEALIYSTLQPYLFGSVRDDFDFGKCVVVNNLLARKIVDNLDKTTIWAGFYDFRLQLSLIGKIVQSSTPLYSLDNGSETDFEVGHFAYCDPRNADYQLEAERVFTNYLKRSNCFVQPVLSEVENFDKIVDSYPVVASVIIPVKDRPEVIADSVNSALEQIADFSFNVIVVDNHSAISVEEILKQKCVKSDKLVVLRPQATDLGIGGCWNFAIESKYCGAFSVQLDSDDVYSSPNTLKTIVDKFRVEKCGVLIGSYRLTDYYLKPLNDFVINHREYTQTNGVNNALRVNGFGAPRCYLTEIVRKNRFLNVSYGEDYDLCLRLSRQYKLSRIYDVLYLCRRWGHNSDSDMTPQKMINFNLQKDEFRSQELMRRKSKS